VTLTKLAEWTKAHPKDPLYQCANIGGKVHLVRHCGLRKLGTVCGLDGDTRHQLLFFLLPAHMVTCAECSKTLSGEK